MVGRTSTTRAAEFMVTGTHGSSDDHNRDPQRFRVRRAQAPGSGRIGAVAKAVAFGVASS